jgi:hypothetical protein
MKKAEFKRLLGQDRDTWLDWQESFPLELLKGEDHPEWETGQARLLRDLAALANRPAGRHGFLVFGVTDHDSRREVKGIFKSWKGTDFQSWAHKVFDPPLRVSYSELALGDNIKVGIFTVDLSPQYPHVVVKSLGGIIHPGQVWVRQGNESTVALHQDLREMFTKAKRAK